MLLGAGQPDAGRSHMSGERMDNLPPPWSSGRVLRMYCLDEFCDIGLVPSIVWHAALLLVHGSKS